MSKLQTLTLKLHQNKKNNEDDIQQQPDEFEDTIKDFTDKLAMFFNRAKGTTDQNHIFNIENIESLTVRFRTK